MPWKKSVRQIVTDVTDIGDSTEKESKKSQETIEWTKVALTGSFGRWQLHIVHLSMFSHSERISA